MTLKGLKPAQLLIAGALCATWFIWGSTYLAIRFALEQFAPFELMGWRFTIAGLVLLVFCKIRHMPWPTLIQWRNAWIVGALMLGGGMASAAYAEKTVSSGLVVTFIAVSPLLMTVMLIPFGEKPTSRTVMGMLTGAIGVALLSQGQGFEASPQGLLAVLFGCITWNAGSILSRYKTPLAPGLMGYASEMLLGGLTLSVMSLLVHEPWPQIMSYRAVGSFIYLIVFGSLIAFNAYMFLLERTRPAVALSYTYINPIIGLSLGMWLAQETLTIKEAVAAGVILIGLIIAITGRR